MSSELIPFGKYRGQPVEVLQNDPEYATWISQQEDLKRRYPQIVNIIINKFGDDEETPEHNAMQAKFMNDGYCAAAALTLGGFGFLKIPEKVCVPKDAVLDTLEIDPWDLVYGDGLFSDCIENVRFEEGAIDVQFKVNPMEFSVWGNPDPALTNDENRQVSITQTTQPAWLKIELKPVVGDDYPAILRQMRNNKSNVLVYGAYTGRGVDESTFRRFFSSQGFRVASIAEIETKAKDIAEKKKTAIKERHEVLCKLATEEIERVKIYQARRKKIESDRVSLRLPFKQSGMIGMIKENKNCDE